MTGKLYMKLDDVVKLERVEKRNTRRKPFANGKRRNTNPRLFSSPKFGQKWMRDRQPTRGPVAAPVKSSQIFISNLDFRVNNSDIKELFSDAGAVRFASVNYDQNGQSLGTAEVTFVDPTSAVNAIMKYNGIQLDGRPMKIQIVAPLSDASSSSAPVRRRLTGTPSQQVRFTNQKRSGPIFKGPFANKRRVPAFGGRPRRGAKVEPVSKETLDQQLDSYQTTMN